MTNTPHDGFAAAGFEGARDAFLGNYEAGDPVELGAACAVYRDGECVLDLWGGFADVKRTRPWARDTLAPIYSSTKAVSALMIARAVEAGEIDYDRLVSEYWPEFGVAGKEAVTVAQALSHQAGLCGFPEPIDAALWEDWDAMCAHLAAMTPMWAPGTASGYHPQTFSFIAGGIYRRATGRTIGQELRNTLAGPHDIDVHIGLDDAHFTRVADLRKPSKPPSLGELNPYRRAAFVNRWSSSPSAGTDAWRRAELPAANGHATARGLARLFSLFATGELADGDARLAPDTRDQASAQRIVGDDLVLPFYMSWGAGLIRNKETSFYGPNPDAFGHSGWGGSCVFADDKEGLSFAYVMNRMGSDLAGDPRPKKIIEALYRAL